MCPDESPECLWNIKVLSWGVGPQALSLARACYMHSALHTAELLSDGARPEQHQQQECYIQGPGLKLLPHVVDDAMMQLSQWGARLVLHPPPLRCFPAGTLQVGNVLLLSLQR